MKLTIRRVLYLVILSLVAVAAMLSVSYFSISDLIYPVRRDSLYMRTVQLEYESRVRSGDALPGRLFLFHPTELGLDAVDMEVWTTDSVRLTGWYVRDSSAVQPVVIIIPDILESKADLIDEAAELAGRGLASCLVDLRMQGASGGDRYVYGRRAARDLQCFVDTFERLPGMGPVVLWGHGTGAVVALQAAIDTTVAVAIAQNPFQSLDRYLHDYAMDKYGMASRLFLPLMKRKFEKEAGQAADSVDVVETVERLRNPALFISFLSEEHLDFRSTGFLYERCAASNKDWIVFRKDYALQDPVERKKYYDRIAAFIQVHLPRAPKDKARRKPLVENAF